MTKILTCVVNSKFSQKVIFSLKCNNLSVSFIFIIWNIEDLSNRVVKFVWKQNYVNFLCMFRSLSTFWRQAAVIFQACITLISAEKGKNWFIQVLGFSIYVKLSFTISDVFKQNESFVKPPQLLVNFWALALCM